MRLRCAKVLVIAGEVEVRKSDKELVMSKIFSWCARQAPAYGVLLPHLYRIEATCG